MDSDKKQVAPQDMMAYRERATSMLQQRIQELHAEAHGLQKLLENLPPLSNEADEALWNLLIRHR